MLFHSIYEQYGVTGLYLALMSFGVLLYVALAGTSYLLFFVWKRARYHPQYHADREELLRSAKWAMYSIAGNAALMVPVELLIIHGSSKIYFSVDAYGWPYLLASAIAVLVITETLIYWIHRGLHLNFFYRHLHRRHHQFREPTPLASVSFHPLDSFAQAAPYHVCAFVFPLNVWLYHVLITFVTLWAVLIHDRIRFIPTEFVNHSGCHMAHHWYYRYNFGQFFTVWDRLCGTYRHAGDLPQKFAAAWPHRHAKNVVMDSCDKLP